MYTWITQKCANISHEMLGHLDHVRSHHHHEITLVTYKVRNFLKDIDARITPKSIAVHHIEGHIDKSNAVLCALVLPLCHETATPSTTTDLLRILMK